MNTLAPGYLTPLILIGAVAVIAAVLYGLRKVLSSAESRKISVLLVAWFFAALATSISGFYRGGSSRIPTIQFGLVIPIVAGLALYWRWPMVKRMVELVPQRWIVSVQFFRVLGVIFLILYAVGRLPGEFAWPAGVGDVIVGLLAPVVGMAYARGLRGSATWLRLWNILGIADLVVAVTTGFLTSPSPLQMLAFDQPNVLISTFPLAMIPVFLVPLAILLHLASLEKLNHEFKQNLVRKSGNLPGAVSAS
jgi:hypothetical protein